MISHELRCIFIHIPRCAGTSVETWLAGQDFWSVDRERKHLIASQAKALYSPYWDSYFKFSIVRNPFTRTLSCLKYASHFGLSFDPSGNIDFGGYHATFGHNVVVEHDHRFHALSDVARHDHSAGCVYGNMLDVPLDYVARYETLRNDMAYVRDAIGAPTAFHHHVESSDLGTAKRSLSRSDQDRVLALYDNDFSKFSYSRQYEAQE